MNIIFKEKKSKRGRKAVGIKVPDPDPGGSSDPVLVRLLCPDRKKSCTLKLILKGTLLKAFFETGILYGF
jgi:hypothetical protein